MLFTALRCIVTPVVSAVVGLVSMVSQPALEGKVWGKVEIAPAYVHLDLLESNQTIQTIDMPAVRGDATIIVGNGWCFKPTVTYGKNKGDLFVAGLGFGHCIPITDCLIVTPVIGYNYTNLTSSITIDWGSKGSVKYNERFRSHTPYAGLDIAYLIRSNLRACANLYWGWSYAETKIGNILNEHNTSSGPTIGLLLEYDLNSCWSVNIGGAWNESLGKNKDGIRAWGGKMGIVRWF